MRWLQRYSSLQLKCNHFQVIFLIVTLHGAFGFKNDGRWLSAKQIYVCIFNVRSPSRISLQFHLQRAQFWNPGDELRNLSAPLGPQSLPTPTLGVLSSLYPEVPRYIALGVAECL
jgi:hypothetical protein